MFSLSSAGPACRALHHGSACGGAGPAPGAADRQGTALGVGIELLSEKVGLRESVYHNSLLDFIETVGSDL